MNNENAGAVLPGRGLRQGDPLSPYLYILCTKGLYSLIKFTERRGMIHGIKICRRAPIITHLLFADDSFIFMKANEREIVHIKNILNKYEMGSGQAINLSKSEMLFSQNVPPDLRAVLCDLLGVQECPGVGRYLGLPSFICRNKKEIFIT